MSTRMRNPMGNRSMTWAAALAVMLAAGATTHAATLWWVGDSGSNNEALFLEDNWSTAADDAAAEPVGDPVNATNIFDDLIIEALYNGSPIGGSPGGGPIDDESGGIGADVNLSGNTVTLSGTTMRVIDNQIISGDAGNMPTINLDSGAQIAAEAMRRSNFTLADTSQALFWGLGTGIFTDSTFNLQGGTSSLRLVNIAPATDISGHLAGAAGFEVDGNAVAGSDLLVSSDGNGGTLLSANTIYWVGDGSGAIFAEENWSAVSNNAGAEPTDPNLVSGSAGPPITVDMVIAGDYNGSATANAPGGGPIDDQTNGIGDDLNFSGNTVTISGTTVRLIDNQIVNGDASDRPTLNLDIGAILAAEAVQDSIVNLTGASQVIFWGTGPVIFDGSTFNFDSRFDSLRLLNIAFGTDISTQLANAAGFEFQGDAITLDQLLITDDGEGGTLVTVAIPAPAALPAGLILLSAVALRLRRV